MKQVLIKHRRILLASLLGATAGYLYYLLVGCSNGGCVISSNPFISTLYGAIMGAVAVGWPETQKINTSTHNE